MYTVSGYGVYFSPVFESRSPLRILSQYEIELYSFANGTGYLDGASFPYEKDRVCVFRPSQQRQSSGRFQCYYLRFSCNLPEVRRYLDALPNRLPAGDPDRFYQLFNDIFNAMAHEQPGYKLYVDAKLTEMIATLYDFAVQTTPAVGKYSSYTAAIYDAVHFMRGNPSEHITLETIAARAHMSPSFFHVVFKSTMGVTPHRYLLELRLNTAKNLLTNSDLSLAGVAEQSGFDSQVYLNYIFKKELHVTPKQYRNAHQNKHYL